ncbi:MAG: Ig-like domain-containing protein, partial [Prevotellaceae bacterium]|nr:Ig-like domain-containing protein [Prevotellaceae bacterium]
MKTFSNKIAIIGMIFYAMVFFACKEDETTIDRKDITVETITATPTQITLATGSTRAIKATVAPNGANQQIYWKSDNPEIATVANGIVTGISTGVVKITVKSVENSSLSGEVSVTVVAAAIPVESIAFDLESPNLTMYLDDELTVGVTFTPVDATNQQLIWQNSAPEVVSVTGEGVITALTRGRATITVKSAADVNITATLSILVTDPSVPVESISIPIDRTAMGVGQTKAITTAVLPDDATDKSLVWSSGSP